MDRKSGADDPSERTARAARSQSLAAWVQNILIVVLALAVGGGGGYVAGHSDQRTVTDTTTETATTTSTVTTPGSTPPPGTNEVNCAPGPGPSQKHEPNNTAGRAAGPIGANTPLRGVLATKNDIDYFAVCVSRPVDLTFTLSCLDPSDTPGCQNLYGEFPKDADLPGYFEPGRTLACSIPSRGKYVLAVEENGSPPARYELMVQTQDADAVVSRIPASLGPPDPEKACSK